MIEYMKNDKTYLVGLDIDAICAYEEEHPDWSIIDEMTKTFDGGRLRVSALNRMAVFVGFESYTAFIESGLDIEDLPEIVQEVLSHDLGFQRLFARAEEQVEPEGASDSRMA